MGAQEFRLGQILLEFLHRHERHDLLVVLKIETNVVLKSLNIQYIIETYSLKFVVALDEHKSVAAIYILSLGHIKPLQGLIGGFQEIVVRDWFQQIVECVNPESLDSILGKRSGKDNSCLSRQNLGKLYAAKFWHLDVEKQ